MSHEFLISLFVDYLAAEHMFKPFNQVSRMIANL